MTQQNATYRAEGARCGPMTPKFELGRDFCTTQLATKFHQPKFNRSKATMLTNTQHDAAENIHLASLASRG